MRVFLTGANGFVGSHIAESLVEAGHEVICLVRKTSNLKWLEGLNVKYVYGSLTDAEVLGQTLKDVDVVVHNAGAVRAQNAAEYNKINADATKTIAEFCLKVNPSLKKFIFISSQAAQGPSASQTPRKTGGQLNPVSDYGISKMKAEEMLIQTLNGKIPYVILRPSAVYGPRDKDIFMFFDLVNKHIKIKTSKKRYVQLVFVKDIAKAVLLCAKNPVSNNKTYYLADSPAYTWQDIGNIIAGANNVKAYSITAPDFVFKTAAFFAEMFGKISGKTPVLNKQKITEITQDYWTADNADIIQDLNLHFTNLEIGARITYCWYLDNKFF